MDENEGVVHVRLILLSAMLVALGCSCSRPPGPVGPRPGGADAGPVEADVAPPPADVSEPEAVAPPPADAATGETELPAPLEVLGDEEHPVRIFFDKDKSEIPEIANSMLDAVGERLRLRPDEVVRLVAHSDSQERPGHAMELSRQRAEALVQYLAEHGIRRERFFIDARGDFEPIGDNETEEGRASNRRVDFVFERGLSS